MNRTASLVALTAALSASACVSHRPPHEVSSGSPGGGQPIAAAPAGEQSAYAANDESARYAPSAPPPSADAEAYASGAPSPATKSERRAMEPAREERPGLGTSWGETRSSRVSSAPFERADSESPFVTTTLSYNDWAGVRAMTRGASLGAAARDGIDVAGGALSVRLLDSSGRPMPTYDFGSRRFVVGSDGDRYVIQIQNHTGNRVEAVTTVDGLDVIDGRPGSFEKRGYLLGPWATVEIDGFRQNFEQVAAFRFGSVRDSYADKKGEGRNVGVIGVAFFAEQNAPYPWLQPEVERRRNADPFPGRFAAPPSY